MDYKILRIKNNISKRIDIKKSLDFFKKNTPLNMIVEEISTNWKVQKANTLAGNDKYKNLCYIGGDILTKIRSIVPPNKYDVVELYSDDTLGCIRPHGIAGLEQIYPGTDFIQIFKYNDGGITENHEEFHTMIFKANRNGAGIVDPMDTYAFNLDMKVDKIINTNREMALQALKPHWNKVVKPTKPIVTITRESDDGVQSLGTLTYKDFTCKTLEKPWKNNALNISCIPKGTYNVVWSFSMKFMKSTYRLEGTAPRSGILIHAGNYFYDIEGCILLGDGYVDLNKDGHLDIVNSRKTIAKFEEIMNKKSFTLIIK